MVIEEVKPGKTILEIQCAYCKCSMGQKDGDGNVGITSSICQKCWRKHFPGKYPKEMNNKLNK